MAAPGPSDGAPSPAQNTIASVVANAPAFSAADVAQPAAPTESEQPAKRGRGRPKRDAGASRPGQDGDASDAPPLADSDAVWPPQFDMRESGLWYCPKGENPSWLSSPFRVLGMVRTYESAGWSLYLSFDDHDGGEQLQAIPYAELQGDGATVRRQLADLGLKIDVKRASREKFAEALASVQTSRRLLRVSQTGWAAEGKAFALPHKTISATGVEPIVFEGRARGAHFGEAGDLSGWRENVAKLAEGQDRLLLALGLALSGPLLDPLGLSGGGFHLVGDSSIGKTSAERIAGSCWGGGGPLGFAQTWKATAGALEATAAAHSDAFLALDEIKLCEPNDVATGAYVLAGGEGKSRLRSDSELRGRLHWRIALLSSGEMSLAARIAEGTRQNKAHAGQSVRIVELQADAGRGFGIFDHVPGGDARALADEIRDATGVYYGFAGPAFVEVLLNKRDETIATAKTIIKTFIAENVPQGANGQIWRVAERFALVAAAGEIAIGVNILPFESGAILDATARLFKGWIAARGGLGSSEARAAVDAVRQFIQAHGKARFIRLDDKDGESHSFRVQNAAGYYSEAKGIYYFSDVGWIEALTGIERKAAAVALFAAGFLQRDSEGFKPQLKIGGVKHRLFFIYAKILEGDENV